MKKLRKQNRMKLADLKQLTPYPEVVESWDVTAKDPKLLVYFKSLKNTVPVPKHWAQKRKYLQSKRGILRPPFQLPDYIEATGISTIRNINNQHKPMSLKMRERMQPKLGRMDIDYQVLHDAFFKHQTKPQLSIHGEVYYENKEFENKMKKFQPGRISSQLRTALGISETGIPPFVANMQRYGPPPSYPNLKIPGVNAPLSDPTAQITPNLWTEPDIKEKKELVWDFKSDMTHWGDLREEGDDDDFADELGGDEDDLEISDDEKPEISGLFEKKNSETGGVRMIEEKQEMDIDEEDNSGKFYKEVDKKESSINVGELHPVGYTYDIPTKKEKKKEIEIPSKEEKEESEHEEEEEEEDYGKKIF